MKINPALATGKHLAAKCAAEDEGRGQIHRQDIIPAGIAELCCGVAADDAGVVHQDVYLMAVYFQLRNQCVDSLVQAISGIGEDRRVA